MRRKKSAIPAVIRFILFIALITFSYYLWQKNTHLEKRLAALRIFHAKGDSLYIVNGSNTTHPIWKNGTDSLTTLILYSPQGINRLFYQQSPFRDGLTYRELLKKYIKNRSQDLYGVRRRTGLFRRIHEGVDLFVPKLTPVYPLADFGIVTEVSDDPHYRLSTTGTDKNNKTKQILVEYGKIVRIRYAEGIESVYAHLDQVFVELGDIVHMDTQVGLTGETGNLITSKKASHLHMEVRDSHNKSFNPANRLHYNNIDAQHYLNNLQIP